MRGGLMRSLPYLPLTWCIGGMRGWSDEVTALPPPHLVYWWDEGWSDEVTALPPPHLVYWWDEGWSDEVTALPPPHLVYW